MQDPIRAAILVEGLSDRAAVEALAIRRGRDLDSEDVAVVAMGGATNVSHFLNLYGPTGLDLVLAGLCDKAEEKDFIRAIERAGIGSHIDRAAMESLGFYVCEADLEEELIRALSVPAVERVIESQGELGSFRILQRQPAQRTRSVEDQLRRFIGTKSGRKIRYGRLMVEALDLDRVPRPLDAVLGHV
jgi:hypothetical protein